MGRLIDTSILIECEKGRLDLDRHTATQDNVEFFVSVVSVSELLHGVHRAKQAHIRAKRSASVEGMLNIFSILEIDLLTARTHSRIWAELESKGQIIGPHDLWLAATCIAHGLTMVTANVREFDRVPGINVETWT